MKRITLTGNLLKVFALVAMLASCQNEDVMTQQSQSDITTNDRNAKITFTPQLLKEGANELEYYGDYDVNRGKLKKLTNIPEGAYTEYQYSGQSVIAQRRNIATQALIYQVTYQLDASGKCVESFSTETNKPLKYEYGQPGRLTKVYNKNNPNERIEFGYEQSNSTSLKNIVFYNQSNTATKEVNYSYVVQGGGSAAENKYPTNPDALGVSSKYLPIFGVIQSYLPNFESTKNLPWNGEAFAGYTLTYAFNSSGYPKTITATSNMGNSTITTNRTYTTPKL